MVFTSVSGHLMEVEFIAPYNKWHGCSPVDLYTAPIAKSVPQVAAGQSCFFLDATYKGHT